MSEGETDIAIVSVRRRDEDSREMSKEDVWNTFQPSPWTRKGGNLPAVGGANCSSKLLSINKELSTSALLVDEIIAGIQ